SIWLTLRAGLRDILLQEHQRPHTLFNDFLDPNVQSPQMITMIGRELKTSVMQKLRFGTGSQDGVHGEIHLRADADSFKRNSPVLFADCELHDCSNISEISSTRPVGGIVRQPLLWHRRRSQDLDISNLAHLLYSKLLAPFSTVICFFADDLGGLSAVAQVLAFWVVGLSNRPSDLPPITNPQVLILTRCRDVATYNEQKATKQFIKGRLKKVELDRYLGAQFGSMRVVPLPEITSSTRSWKSLRSRILQDSADLQLRRTEAQVAFSASHFAAFFRLACEHFCADIVSPFSFVSSSRDPNPISTEYISHLNRFLNQVPMAQLLSFAVPVIASAFVFDSYPPGMHFFNPILVFRQFYYQICLKVDPFRDRNQPWDSHTPQFASAVEVAFCQYAFDVIKSRSNDESIHRKALLKYKELWKGVRSTATCFSCFARSPENTLKCKHSLCSTCTIAHGISTELEPWNFRIEVCPLCEEFNGKSFSQKPNTAGVRAIILEGGGIRGIVPLSFLKDLEKYIDLPMGIQEHFDIAFGSSSGALILLGLFVNRWSVDECTNQFQRLSRVVFEKRWYCRIPLISVSVLRPCLDIIWSFATDSRYSSSGVNRALKSAFGDISSVFQSPCGGTKVAVVATTTNDTSTCLFTNYNGPESRSSSSGYKIIRPDNAEQELLVWQAARASSAAPPYFKPFAGYQDGGLGGHNNPINLALWEQDIIWSRQMKQPDLVVSLGTGYKRNTEDDCDSDQKASFIRNRCVPRLFRSFLNLFVGESRWQELQNSLLPRFRDRYHRLNIEFNGDEPELDEVRAMPNLRQQAKFQAQSNDHVQKCADNILASLFYLELDTLPTFHRSSFVCRGRICCRITPRHKALQALARRLIDTKASFYLNSNQHIPGIDDESYNAIEGGAAYCRNVTFNVISLDDLIDIKIDGISKRARSISNCPYKVQTLIRDQGLDCVFGHRKNKRRVQVESERNCKRVKFA
ncbi:acyl transferase/acyl hydrolase/lysophospholipase, partial [Hyaloscypha sp. PMI_1271]